MRYMGNKKKLLDFIVPCVEALTKPGDTILDLMSGTCSVAYALKHRNRLLVNDIHAYSHTIGLALVENSCRQVSRQLAERDLQPFILSNTLQETFSFFQSHYADTYFSYPQCRDIDSIRFAIEEVNDPYQKAVYLTILIFAMCYSQSTSGHFAQYLHPQHARLQPLRLIDLKEVFFNKCDELRIAAPACSGNKAFCLDAADCISTVKDEGVRLVYLDPPYSAAQYSRFYHLLETMVLYDSPRLSFKGLYRQNRYHSPFCYRSRVAGAFKQLVLLSRRVLNANLVISYSDRGLLPLDELVALCRDEYNEVDVLFHSHPHSSQGKGVNTVREVLIRCVSNN
jgi:adenine-specific DNA-methyltransferase